MVSALDFRSEGRGFEPGHCHCIVSLEVLLNINIVSLNKWVLVFIMIGMNRH